MEGMDIASEYSFAELCDRRQKVLPEDVRMRCRVPDRSQKGRDYVYTDISLGALMLKATTVYIMCDGHDVFKFRRTRKFSSVPSELIVNSINVTIERFTSDVSSFRFPLRFPQPKVEVSEEDFKSRVFNSSRIKWAVEVYDPQSADDEADYYIMDRLYVNGMFSVLSTFIYLLDHMLFCDSGLRVSYLRGVLPKRLSDAIHNALPSAFSKDYPKLVSGREECIVSVPRNVLDLEKVIPARVTALWQTAEAFQRTAKGWAAKADLNLSPGGLVSQLLRAPPTHGICGSTIPQTRHPIVFVPYRQDLTYSGAMYWLSRLMAFEQCYSTTHGHYLRAIQSNLFADSYLVQQNLVSSACIKTFAGKNREVANPDIRTELANHGKTAVAAVGHTLGLLFDEMRCRYIN
jgi:hypothetical protein